MGRERPRFARKPRKVGGSTPPRRTINHSKNGGKHVQIPFGKCFCYPSPLQKIWQVNNCYHRGSSIGRAWVKLGESSNTYGLSVDDAGAIHPKPPVLRVRVPSPMPVFRCAIQYKKQLMTLANFDLHRHKFFFLL